MDDRIFKNSKLRARRVTERTSRPLISFRGTGPELTRGLLPGAVASREASQREKQAQPAERKKVWQSGKTYFGFSALWQMCGWPFQPQGSRLRIGMKQMSVLTSSRATTMVLLGLMASLPATPIGAIEAADGAGARVEKRAPLVQTYATPQAALQAGIEGFQSGDTKAAIAALKYAANGGESLAQWKLAKIYANGDGAPRDDLKAYDYFSQIVSNYDEDNPDRRDTAIVSSAIVALGVYSLNGIANSKVNPDPQRALRMFQFAATNFGDANAQYHLARMHLEGAGVQKDSREGIRWLFLAADKGHPQAEALLGETLFAGREGVQPQRARGLMWLTLAREAAIDSKKDQWIIDLYDKAVASANDEDRQDALAFLEDHLKRRN